MPANVNMSKKVYMYVLHIQVYLFAVMGTYTYEYTQKYFIL